LSRRIGRSQNGTGRVSSWPFPLADVPARSAGSAGGVDGSGLGAVPDRCLLPPAAGQPLAGQAGREPERPEPDVPEPDWPEPPRIGGADRAGPRPAAPRERAGVRDAPVPGVVTAGPGDAA